MSLEHGVVSPRPASVELLDVTKKYGGMTAVSGVNLTVKEGEFVAILGPSGSGKTSILMIVAGFVDPTSGDIRVSGRSMLGIPPEERGIGVVFQNYALFPHLRVEQNISFPLEMRGKSRAEIADRVHGALKLVGMNGLERRYPHELSGGQQQRVALARALIFEPKLLLMDEPLGALDKNLRQQMQQELRALHRDLGTTILFVTHDQEEALSLASRVAIMQEGRLIQIDRPENLYHEPHSRFVASFMGDCNFLPIEEVRQHGDEFHVRIGGYAGVISADHSARGVGPGAELAIRPHFVAVSADQSQDGLPGKIKDAVFLGQLTEYLVEVGQGREMIVRRISGMSERALRVGDGVRVTWSWTSARIL